MIFSYVEIARSVLSHFRLMGSPYNRYAAMRKKQTVAIGLIYACLAPVFYAGMSSSAKLAGAHMSIWQIGVGRFGLGLIVVPIIVRALGLSLWGRNRSLLTIRGRMRYDFVSAPGGRFPADPSFDCDGAFLSVPRVYGDLFSMVPWGTEQQADLGLYFRRIHRHHLDSLAVRSFRRFEPGAYLCDHRLGALRLYAVAGQTIGQREQHLHPLFLPVPCRDFGELHTVNRATHPDFSRKPDRLVDTGCGGRFFNRRSAFHQYSFIAHSGAQSRHYDDGGDTACGCVRGLLSQRAVRLAADRRCIVDIRLRDMPQSHALEIGLRSYRHSIFTRQSSYL